MRQTDRQTDRQADRQAGRQAGRDRKRQTDKQTDRQTMSKLKLDFKLCWSIGCQSTTSEFFFITTVIILREMRAEAFIAQPEILLHSNFYVKEISCSMLTQFVVRYGISQYGM